MTLPTVKVLLSTYNGEEYLLPLLDTLMRQQQVTVRLVIRDDGSTDRTPQLLKEYQYDHDIKVDFGQNVGWRDSFMTLLKNVPADDDSDYYAFADQDDLYDSDKLIIAVNRLADMNNQPALYHSNVTFADAEGRPLGDKYPRDMIPTTKLPECYFDSKWMGTTMVFNRGLMALIRRHVPINNTVHDAYVINIAQFFGTVIYDSTPHMKYRRHESAATGFGKSNSVQKIKTPTLLDRYRRYKANKYPNPFSNRAKEILIGYDALLSPAQRSFLTVLAEYRQNLPARLRLIFDPRIRASNLRQTLQIRYRVIANTL
ncbi:glycosyltransferase [Lacticaseibacillus salsurivasis]|uniref:glycosyltransferase n=1 Tax=Lacticaseibacillus salsurivasis TaxID=3081441 RepID=UPI0030C75B86